MQNEILTVICIYINICLVGGVETKHSHEGQDFASRCFCKNRKLLELVVLSSNVGLVVVLQSALYQWMSLWTTVLQFPLKGEQDVHVCV